MPKPPAVQQAAAVTKDLVCGMDVDPKDPAVAARKVDYNGQELLLLLGRLQGEVRRRTRRQYVQVTGETPVLPSRVSATGVGNPLPAASSAVQPTA